MRRRALGLELEVNIIDGPAGLREAIERRTAATAEAVTNTLTVTVRTEQARPGFWLVLDGDGQPLGHADATEDLASFIADRYHHALFEHCTAASRLVIHAGVVGVNGQAILIPGASRSGKSTLVTALVDAGAGYLSDEFAILDQRGRVWPYPRPIATRPAGSTERPAPAEAPPPNTVDEPLPVSLIVETSYQPEHVWQPEIINGSAAVLPLLANAAEVRTRPDLALSIGAGLAGVPLQRGARGEAAATATAIIETVPARVAGATVPGPGQVASDDVE